MKKKQWHSLSCQKTLKISKAIVRVTPEVLSARENLSASTIIRLVAEQARVLKKVSNYKFL